MDIVLGIFTIILYVAFSLIIYIPIIAWWVQFFQMRKLRKTLDSGGIDFGKISQHLK